MIHTVRGVGYKLVPPGRREREAEGTNVEEADN